MAVESAPERRAVGRARDPEIDVRVLDIVARHLAAYGYTGMSIAAVAEAAGTTRQAVYRRWPTKAVLVESALDQAFEASDPEEGSDGGPLQELIDELRSFQRGVSRPGRLSLVGTMLQDSTDPVVRAQYRARVVAPRRERIRNILERAREQGAIDADADLEVALTMCTGSWYGRALAEDEPLDEWPIRVAELVWRAVGGAPQRDTTAPSEA